MQSCQQCKLKSKASFSCADLISFVFTPLSTTLLKPAACRDLGKKGRLCKATDTILEKYRMNSETKRSTEFQMGRRICDQTIHTGGLKPNTCSLVGPVMAQKTLNKARLWCPHFLASRTNPFSEAIV